VIAQDLPVLHPGQGVFDAGADLAVGDVEVFLPVGQHGAVTRFAVGIVNLMEVRGFHKSARIHHLL